MEKQVIFVALCLLISAWGSPVQPENCFAGDKDSAGSNRKEENGIENEENELDVAKTQFAFDLFHELKTEDEDETNVFYSPNTIHRALMLALVGAKGQTESQIRQLLRLNETEGKAEILRKFQSESRILRNSSLSSVQFNVASRLFFNEDEPVRMCIRKNFEDDGIDFVNFANSKEAARKINKWVEAETKGKIKEGIPEGDLSSSSRIALANTAYFKGVWEQEFDKNATSLALFHISSEKVTPTQMMYVKGNFRHGVSSSLKSYILELPYKGNTHSMIIVLPPYVPGAMNETVSKLNAETFTESVDNLRNFKNDEFSFNDEVEIYLPKFKLEQSFELTKTLKSLGVVDLFDSKSADLGDFSEKPGLSFDTAIHKSFLEVNEEGSEAASAVFFISSRQGRLHPLTRYVINRPFVFFIVDNTRANDILFAGVIKSPKLSAIKKPVEIL